MGSALSEANELSPQYDIPCKMHFITLPEENFMTLDGFVAMIKEKYKNNYDYHTKGNKLVKTLNTGGYEGGNCWNDDEPTYQSNDLSDKDYEMPALQDIILDYWPSICYLKFVELKEACYSQEERTELEYYGNSEDYLDMTIDLEKLYFELKGELKWN